LALVNNNPSSLNSGTIDFNDIEVKAGQHITFTCKLSGIAPNMHSGSVHDITIATLRGSNFKAQFNVS
jgi:hypothetical protein